MDAEDKLKQLKELLQSKGRPSRVGNTDWDTKYCNACTAPEVDFDKEIQHENNCNWKLIDELLSEVAQG